MYHPPMPIYLPPPHGYGPPPMYQGPEPYCNQSGPPEMQQMLYSHYMMMEGRGRQKQDLQGLRRVVSTYAAQLYGQTLRMEDGKEKLGVRKAVRSILLKDPDVDPRMIDPVEFPPPRMTPETNPGSDSSASCADSPVPFPTAPQGRSLPLAGVIHSRLHPYLKLDLPQVSGRYPWKEVERPLPPSGHTPSKHVVERLDQRWKQVVIGLLTKGHRNFKQAYQNGEELPTVPAPPDIYTECSKREFDRQLRHWRRSLHLFDDRDDGEHDDDEEEVESGSVEDDDAPSLVDDDVSGNCIHPFAWSAPTGLQESKDGTDDLEQNFAATEISVLGDSFF
eukprot:TRINITY_DN12094_c0_g1_i1.p1 TRINITY_DN12094_c0_g1~~TRINITY_DN12094_c0_g1_i1.p1  ORF type:complete len:342 (+),score=64.51 TRINITY_DN12094_c0_g1_i1:25-1026(+)